MLILACIAGYLGMMLFVYGRMTGNDTYNYLNKVEETKLRRYPVDNSVNYVNLFFAFLWPISILLLLPAISKGPYSLSNRIYPEVGDRVLITYKNYKYKKPAEIVNIWKEPYPCVDLKVYTEHRIGKLFSFPIGRLILADRPTVHESMLVNDYIEELEKQRKGHKA